MPSLIDVHKHFLTALLLILYELYPLHAATIPLHYNIRFPMIWRVGRAVGLFEIKVAKNVTVFLHNPSHNN